MPLPECSIARCAFCVDERCTQKEPIQPHAFECPSLVHVPVKSHERVEEIRTQHYRRGTMINVEDIQVVPIEDLGEDPDGARCPECKWEGPIADCSWEYEQESWEHPPYKVHLCPKCGGSIDDYFFLEDSP